MGKICWNCHKEVPDDSSTCMFCGAAFLINSYTTKGGDRLMSSDQLSEEDKKRSFNQDYGTDYKFCRFCGSEITRVSAGFCPKCGRDISWNEENDDIQRELSTPCPICGAKSYAGEVYCYNCGALLNVKDSKYSKQPQEKKTKYVKKQPSSRHITIWHILFALALMISGFFVPFIAIHGIIPGLICSAIVIAVIYYTLTKVGVVYTLISQSGLLFGIVMVVFGLINGLI